MTVRLDDWQYRLRPDASNADVAGCRLELGEGLPKVRVLDAGGQPAGLILGHPISLGSASLVKSDYAVQIPQSAGAEALMDILYEDLAGRFVVVLDMPGARRLYLDCAGQIPCVFNATDRVAGSTAHAILDDTNYDARFDRALYNALGIEQQGWFPAGLTAHESVSRLLPNHYLDLESFSVHRHWLPRPSPDQPPEDCVDAIVSVVRAQMNALHKGDLRIAQALTAGRETRMLLAMARPWKDETDFVTVTGGDQYSVDTVMAGRIAVGERLQHRALPRIRASGAARDVYLRRAGHCIADANAWYFPSVASIAESHVFLGGAGGETGRGFFWKGSDTTSTELTADILLARFGMSPEPKVLGHLKRWLLDLEGLNALEILDLAYLEQRMGPWAGAQFCSDPTLLRLAPLLSRKSVSAMLSLPPEWKRNEGMGDAVVAMAWPELARYPYNSLGPIKDLIAKASRVLEDPTLLVRKLRKMRH